MEITYISFDVNTARKGIRTFCKNVKIGSKVIAFAEKVGRTFRVLTDTQYQLALDMYNKQVQKAS